MPQGEFREGAIRTVFGSTDVGILRRRHPEAVLVCEQWFGRRRGGQRKAARLRERKPEGDPITDRTPYGKHCPK